jgi:hypothetical protein
MCHPPCKSPKLSRTWLCDDRDPLLARQMLHSDLEILPHGTRIDSRRIRSCFVVEPDSLLFLQHRIYAHTCLLFPSHLSHPSLAHSNYERDSATEVGKYLRHILKPLRATAPCSSCHHCDISQSAQKRSLSSRAWRAVMKVSSLGGDAAPAFRGLPRGCGGAAQRKLRYYHQAYPMVSQFLTPRRLQV